MASFIDLVGQTFGRLAVLNRVENRGKDTCWLCKCECGAEIVARTTHLRSGHTTSCGCLRRDWAAEHFITHGKSATRLHRVYRSMKGRCTNTKDPAYKYYGARGIRVCDEWMSSVEPFLAWAEENGYREGLTIDRIDNDGDYSPENCRFVDRTMQANNKRTNRRHVYNGTSYTLAQLGRLSGLCAETISNRLDVQGMSVQEAVETPQLHKGGRKKKV